MGPTVAQGTSVEQHISSSGFCHPSLSIASDLAFFALFISEGILNIYSLHVARPLKKCYAKHDLTGLYVVLSCKVCSD